MTLHLTERGKHNFILKILDKLKSLTQAIQLKDNEEAKSFFQRQKPLKADNRTLQNQLLLSDALSFKIALLITVATKAKMQIPRSHSLQ